MMRGSEPVPARRLIGRMPTDPRLPLAAARLRLLDRQPVPEERPRPGRGRATLRQRQARYLAAITNTSSIGHACREAGISRRLISWWRAVDPAFRERERQAREDFYDLIRWQLAALATRSDVALILMAKALLEEYMPARRRDHAVVEQLPARFTLALAPVEEMEV